MWLFGVADVGGEEIEETPCTMLQAGNARSKTMLKSWRHQRDIVMTEYREPEANAMGLAGFLSR
jgi:hypothetical protein